MTGEFFYAIIVQEEAELLIEEAKRSRKGERDSLLIQVLYQTGLRTSKALSPSRIRQFEGRPALEVIGKGRKLRMFACPERLSEKLQAYAYQERLEVQDKFFPINRQRAWQILKELSHKVGLPKRVYPHLLRHSDAIERLRQTGNPKALQHQVGHASTTMVMRYLSTLTKEDSLRIQREADFEE